MAYSPITDGPAAASISSPSPSPAAPPMTEAQRLLATAHGTPAEFARACYEAVPSFIGMDEAAEAVRKYRAEWDAAAATDPPLSTPTASPPPQRPTPPPQPTPPAPLVAPAAATPATPTPPAHPQG